MASEPTVAVQEECARSVLVRIEDAPDGHLLTRRDRLARVAGFEVGADRSELSCIGYIQIERLRFSGEGPGDRGGSSQIVLVLPPALWRSRSTQRNSASLQLGYALRCGYGTDGNQRQP